MPVTEFTTQNNNELREVDMKVNRNYSNLEDSYLFSTIARKVNEFSTQNPNTEIIRLGIGDVTLPLCPAVVSAMQDAVKEMGQAETFRGYGPEQGYDFLKESIKNYNIPFWKKLGTKTFITKLKI